MGSLTDTCPPCHDCGTNTQVSFTMATRTGRYCRCMGCQSIWHYNMPTGVAEDAGNDVASALADDVRRDREIAAFITKRAKPRI